MVAWAEALDAGRVSGDIVDDRGGENEPPDAAFSGAHARALKGVRHS